MIAFAILLLALLSRLLPHLMHGTGYNVTLVGAGLLFFGSRQPRWQALLAAAAMALTDIYLTTQVYGMAFHAGAYLLTWCWYLAACLLGSALLRKVTVLRVLAGVFASATSFFLLSNLSVWAGSGMYSHDLSGLGACFAAALPFYGNDLVSTGLGATVLFGLTALARSTSPAWDTTWTGNRPA